MYKFTMVSVETSPTNRTYLIGINAPQAVELDTRILLTFLKGRGLISSPLAPFIPLIEFSDAPKAPVPGLLPPCPVPLIPSVALEYEQIGGWITRPVDSGGWIDMLREAIAAQEMKHGKQKPKSDSLLYPQGKGIPLARSGTGLGKEEVDWIMSSPEVGRILENPPGWRTLKLICWCIESVSGRPWYMSSIWYPLWSRRLKRAPKATNNNK